MKKLLTALLFFLILNCSNLKGQFSKEWTKYPYGENGYSLYDSQVDESGNLYFIERGSLWHLADLKKSYKG